MNILLVEDNPGDVRLTKEALREGGLAHHLIVASDGEEALRYLADAEALAKPMPDIIFLDLNLPKKDGREVLAEIKKHPFLKIIPVVILTTSEADQDIQKSYELHANCYITKPVDINHFIELITSIEKFWFSIVKLPNRKN